LICSGSLYFIDEKSITLDFLNSSYEKFIECIDYCNSFFIENPEFTKSTISKTNLNAMKLQSLKSELYKIDNEISKDGNNAWNVFVEELHCLLE
jgi:hypothetical protein